MQFSIHKKTLYEDTVELLHKTEIMSFLNFHFGSKDIYKVIQKFVIGMVNQIENDKAFDSVSNFYLSMGIVIHITKLMSEDYDQILQIFKQQRLKLQLL